MEDDATMLPAEKAGGEAMPERDLIALLDTLDRQSVGYLNSEIASEQEEAIKRYYGRPYGDEREGRSRVIDRTISVVIDNALAAVLKPFVSADESVSFSPQGPEDEEAAKQATDYVNHVVQVENDGFLLFHNWFKDALLMKLGIVKVWWQDKTAPKRSRAVVTAEEFEAVAAQVVEGPFETEQPGVFEVVLEQEYADGCVKIEGVPPEEFRVTPYSRTVAESPYLAHVTRKARSYLVELGFDRDVIDGLPEYTAAGIDDGRERTRYADEEAAGGVSVREGERSQDWIEVHHEFPLVDFNGDGIAERREIIRVGDTILYNEEVEDHPFAVLCPKPMPHKVYGLSLADDLFDLERINTSLLRGTLDNTYATNNPRPTVDMDKVTEDTVDDLLNPAPGAPIRARGDAIGAFAVPFTADKSFMMLDLMERRVTARTGVSMLGQGMDANTLKKEQTATEAAIQDDGRNARLEMVARIFAETGVKDLFRKVLRLLIQHQPREKVIRLRNEWVPIDPRSWNADMDVTIAVGLGVGNKATKVANAQAGLEALERLAMSPYGDMIKPMGVYKVFKQLFEAIGHKNIDDVLQEPTEEMLAQRQEKPDPEMAKVQAELQMKQGEMQAKQQEAAMKLQLQQAEAQTKQALERERAEFEAQLASEKANREFDLAQQRMAMEMQLAEQRMAFEMEMAREKAQADRDAKIESAKIGADAKISQNRPGGSLSE